MVWVILLNEFSKIYPSWFLNLTKWLEIPGMPLVWFGLASSSSIVWRCWLRWFLKSLPTLSIAWNLKILIKLMQHISFKDLLWKRETKKRDPKKVFDFDGIGLFLWHYYSVSDNPTLTYSNVQSNLVHHRNFTELFAEMRGKGFHSLTVCVVGCTLFKIHLSAGWNLFIGSSTEVTFP